MDVLRCCDRALEINPREAPTWILKGVGLCALERYQEAIRCLQEAEKLGDTNAAAHIAHSRRALTRDAERYFRLGSQYQEEGNNAEAIACYAKGLAIEPHNAAVWINKGAALLALNRATEAVACFDRAISLDPNDSSAWNNKGIALMSLGQREEGATCLLKAIRMREKKAEQ